MIISRTCTVDTPEHFAGRIRVNWRAWPANITETRGYYWCHAVDGRQRQGIRCRVQRGSRAKLSLITETRFFCQHVVVDPSNGWRSFPIPLWASNTQRKTTRYVYCRVQITSRNSIFRHTSVVRAFWYDVRCCARAVYTTRTEKSPF